MFGGAWRGWALFSDVRLFVELVWASLGWRLGCGRAVWEGRWVGMNGGCGRGSWHCGRFWKVVGRMFMISKLLRKTGGMTRTRNK